MQTSLGSKWSSCALGLIFAAVGCGGGGMSSTGSNSTGSGGGVIQWSPSTSIYVTSNLVQPPGSVLQFPRTANGNTVPTATVTGTSGFYFDGLAIDSAGDLYVGADKVGTTEILEYAPGTTTPAKTIMSSDFQGNPSIDAPIYSMDVDSNGNLYVGAGWFTVGTLGYQGVAVFSGTANGNAAPTRTIAGSSTSIFTPAQLALDSANNLYVANYNPASTSNNILIFSGLANGNVAPTNTIGGSKTTIYYAEGVAVDNAGNIYVATEAPGPTGGVTAPTILEFSAGSVGNVAPVRTISGTSTGMMYQIWGLRVDSAGNVYVLNEGSATVGTEVLEFAPSAIGNAAPTAVISSSSLPGFLPPVPTIALQH